MSNQPDVDLSAPVSATNSVASYDKTQDSDARTTLSQNAILSGYLQGIGSSVAFNAKWDPLSSHLFAINLGGWATGYFISCTGLAAEVDVIEHKLTHISGEPYVIRIPGRPKWAHLILKRGVIAAPASGRADFWGWMDYVLQGKMLKARLNCSVYLYNKDGTVAASWDVLNAWPSKISGTDMDTTQSTVAVETLELVIDDLWRVS